MSDLSAALGAMLHDAYEPDSSMADACRRVARNLKSSGKRAIGFCPAEDSVAVVPFALRLGLALGEVTGQQVALVDANVRYPAFPIDQDHLANGDGEGETFIFSERTVSDRLVLLTPRRIGAAGAGVPQLELLINRFRGRFAHLLVDLTGFDLLGDHLNAAALLDGIIVVARSGRTKERNLLRMRAEFAAEHIFGVVLTG